MISGEEMKHVLALLRFLRVTVSISLLSVYVFCFVTTVTWLARKLLTHMFLSLRLC